MVVPLCAILFFRQLQIPSSSTPSDDIRMLQDTTAATRIRLAIDGCGAFGDSLLW